MKAKYSLFFYATDSHGKLIPIKVTRSKSNKTLIEKDAQVEIWDLFVLKILTIVNDRKKGLNKKINVYYDETIEKDHEKIIILFVDAKALSSNSFYHIFSNSILRQFIKPIQDTSEYQYWPIITVGGIDILSVFNPLGSPTEKYQNSKITALHSTLDPRVKFLDSSIWHRYVSYLNDFESGFIKTLKNIVLYSDLRLYKSIEALAALEFQCRILGSSYTIRHEDRGHHEAVTPFKFHSESEILESTKIVLNIFRENNILKRGLSFLIVSRNADLAISTLDKSANISKKQIIEEWLSELNYSEVNTNKNKSIVNIQKFDLTYSKIATSKLQQGIELLSNNSYDIVFLDYLLGDDSGTGTVREYGHELLLLMNEENSVLLPGPFGKNWIFPISSFPYSFNDKLRQLNISSYEKLLISQGGDPITTPSLFIFNLLRLILRLITPPEIYNKGIETIREYFASLKKQESEGLFEAKLLLIGEPGVGKTTFSRKLINPSSPMPREDESTKGISIKNFTFTTRSGNIFKANIWDFGGQEIYKAAHQFFLTQRSLYVLVIDSRCVRKDLDYWLQKVNTLGKNSPLIILFNEKTERDLPQLNEVDLRSRFSIFKETINANLKTNKGLDQATEKIKYYLENLSHIGDHLPIQWIIIRTTLSKLAESNPFIYKRDFNDICVANNINDAPTQSMLSQYFHDLGVFLHFKEDYLLERYVFLWEDWITNAVFKLLDAPVITNQRGLFNVNQLSEIWDEENYSSMHPELLRLMICFELCYQIPNSYPESYIVPQLLPPNKPDYDWNINNEPEITLRYQYSFMPKGVMTKLIVRLHSLIEDQSLVWKEGLLLSNSSERAEILEVYSNRLIQIRVYGDNPRILMSRIVDEVNSLNDFFPNLIVEKLVPCICSECMANNVFKYFFKYQTLERFIKKGKKIIQCEYSTDDVSITAMLDAIYLNQGFGSKINTNELKKSSKAHPSRIFVSYAYQDTSAVERLKTALSIQIKSGKVEFWYDHMIVPGGIWHTEIEERLKNSDVILLLLSHDFWESSIVWEVQLPLVEQLYDQGQVKVLPILYRPNDWLETEWKHIQAAPVNEKGKLLPIIEWEKEDNAWQVVIESIKSIIV